MLNHLGVTHHGENRDRLVDNAGLDARLPRPLDANDEADVSTRLDGLQIVALDQRTRRVHVIIDEIFGAIADGRNADLVIFRVGRDGQGAQQELRGLRDVDIIDRVDQDRFQQLVLRIFLLQAGAGGLDIFRLRNEVRQIGDDQLREDEDDRIVVEDERVSAGRFGQADRLDLRAERGAVLAERFLDAIEIFLDVGREGAAAGETTHHIEEAAFRSRANGRSFRAESLAGISFRSFALISNIYTHTQTSMESYVLGRT
ncbi:unnamed protein product [Sphagnum balticum]